MMMMMMILRHCARYVYVLRLLLTYLLTVMSVQLFM